MTTNAADAEILSEVDGEELAEFYEKRADHLEADSFAQNTVITNDTEEWIRELTAPGAKLFVGPRGCGKTHLMRFAYAQCKESHEKPFAVYTNLNRYYRLEPLLRKRPDAISMFYTWLLANIFSGLHDAYQDFKTNITNQLDPELLFDFNIDQVRHLIGLLELSKPLNEEEQQLANFLTIDKIKALIIRASDTLGRKKTVLLLDDAALTLTPEYLAHFFDIFRSIKAGKISPKASVYPGTTEYGPSFHAAHEADTIFVWKSMTDENYLQYMLDIGEKRFTEFVKIPPDTRNLLAYAAFGVPRAYLSLLRSYNKLQSISTNSPQSLLNKVIEEFCSEKMSEYLSLREKKPQLVTIINAGQSLFSNISKNLAIANQELINESHRQIFIGIQADGIEQKPYIERMLLLLQEVGMVYKYSSVSHGDRTYLRYTPHSADLLRNRAFTRKGGYSPRFSLEMIQRSDSKHPLRRSIGTLLSDDIIEGLGLDLPNCQSCGAKRVDGAKYCVQCGAKLTEESSYDRIMESPLSKVPGLTGWQRRKLEEAPMVPKTIGEFQALQDKGTVLRTIPWIGKARALTVINTVESYVAEYLS